MKAGPVLLDVVSVAVGSRYNSVVGVVGKLLCTREKLPRDSHLKLKVLAVVVKEKMRCSSLPTAEKTLGWVVPSRVNPPDKS